MQELNSLIIASVKNGFNSEDPYTRLEAIHSVLHLKIQEDPNIQICLHKLVDDPVDYVAGLAILALLEGVICERVSPGKILKQYQQEFPYTATICYLGYMIWMAITNQIPISFKPKWSSSIDFNKIEKNEGTQYLQRIVLDVIRLYIFRYWMAFYRNIKLDNSFARLSDQHKRFIGLNLIQDIESHLFQISKNRIAWLMVFISIKSNQNDLKSLASQVLTESHQFDDLIKMQSWLIEVSGRGSNVIDTLYRLPDGFDKRLEMLIKLMENGPDGDMSMYWWTVSSAIEKLADPIFRGNKIVYQSLLTKLEEFIPAERAYERKKVGQFQVMYVPVWPYGQKGIYYELTDALAEVGDASVLEKLRNLLNTSPYPEAIAKCILRIEQRLTVPGEMSNESIENKDDSGEENYFRIGVDLLEKGKIDEAIHNLEQAAKLNPKSSNIFYYLGFCWIEKEMFDVVLDNWKRALEIEPEADDIMANIASIYAILGKTEKAIEMCDRALSHNPACEHAWINKAQILESKNNKNEAIKCLERGLIECPVGLTIRQHLQDFESSNS